MDGGEHGREVLGCVYVVNAYQGHILWNMDALLLKGPHGADGRQVIAAEDGADVRLALKEELGPLVAVLRRELYIGGGGRAEGEAAGVQRVTVAQVALLIFRFPSLADPAVAQA